MLIVSANYDSHSSKNALVMATAALTINLCDVGYLSTICIYKLCQSLPTFSKGKVQEQHKKTTLTTWPFCAAGVFE
jgi:hypothetical protein